MQIFIAGGTNGTNEPTEGSTRGPRRPKKLGQNVHHNSGVGVLCPHSKILCDLGQNVFGHFVLGYFVFWGKMSPSLHKHASGV